jgi:hypothetical protein
MRLSIGRNSLNFLVCTLGSPRNIRSIVRSQETNHRERKEVEIQLNEQVWRVYAVRTWKEQRNFLQILIYLYVYVYLWHTAHLILWWAVPVGHLISEQSPGTFEFERQSVAWDHEWGSALDDDCCVWWVEAPPLPNFATSKSLSNDGVLVYRHNGEPLWLGVEMDGERACR